MRSPFDNQASAAPPPAPPRLAEALELRYQLLRAPDGAIDAQSFAAAALLHDLLEALEQGQLRVAEPAAEPAAESGLTPAWRVHPWLRSALVDLAPAGGLTTQPGPLPGTDLAILGWRETRTLDHRIPAGSFIRRGCFLAPGLVLLPPSVIQAGAYIDPGVRMDAHALIGSCAQIGEGVVIGAGCILAGLLLPAETLPVILEPGVLLAAQNGIYGSVVIGAQTVLHPGVILRASEGVYDATTGAWLRADDSGTLWIPPHSEISTGLAPTPASPGGIQRLTACLTRRANTL